MCLISIEILLKLYFVFVTIMSNVTCPLAQENAVSTTNNALSCARVKAPKVLSVNENKYLRGYVFHFIEEASLITCGLR